MNGVQFTQLHRLAGHKIVDTASCSWIIQDNKTAISCPPLISAFPSPSEFKSVFKQGARFISFKTEMSDKNFCEYIFQGNSYELADFDRKIRNRIKKGLSSCQVRDASLSDLLDHGLKINQQTTDRQAREEFMLSERAGWEKYIATMCHTDDVYIKGAYVDEILVAYAIFIKVEDKYYIYHPYMLREYSSCCPINAIYYVFFNQIIEAEGSIIISAGLSSYVEKKELDRFKSNMRLEMIPCSRVLVISPLILPLINTWGNWVLRQLIQLRTVRPELLEQYQILLASKNLYKAYLENQSQKGKTSRGLMIHN